MKLIFGLSGDGRAYPDFPGSGAGVLDEAVVGPAGLTSILELALGLTAPHPSEAVRVAAFAAKLAIALKERPGCFFAKSFEGDAWATAHLLLGWRDQLIEAGWNGQPCAHPRLNDLALAESAGDRLLAGLPDRLQGLSQALGTRPALELNEVAFIEPLGLLPPIWRRLFGQLVRRLRLFRTAFWRQHHGLA